MLVAATAAGAAVSVAVDDQVGTGHERIHFVTIQTFGGVPASVAMFQKASDLAWTGACLLDGWKHVQSSSQYRASVYMHAVADLISNVSTCIPFGVPAPTTSHLTSFTTPHTRPVA
jgi:hypothetical protein